MLQTPIEHTQTYTEQVLTVIVKKQFLATATHFFYSGEYQKTKSKDGCFSVSFQQQNMANDQQKTFCVLAPRTI